MADIARDTEATPKRGRGRTVLLTVIAVAVLAALGGLIWWAASRPEPQPPAASDYAAAWESAMKKAGVDATMPAEPTPITAYKGFGSHEFDATFTGDEATALVNVYTLQAEVDGQKVAIDNPTIDFPEPGVVKLTGTVTFGDQSVAASIRGPVTYTLVDRIRAPEGADVSIEGFSLGGAKRQQAIDGVLSIGNQYIIDAPKLIVTEAEVVNGGIRVKGQAPNRLDYVGTK